MLLKKVFRGVERIFSEALVPWSENDVGGHIISPISKGRHPAKPWHYFDQDVLSFAVTLAPEDIDACCIAVRSRHRVHEAGPEHIICDRNDRDRLRRLL